MASNFEYCLKEIKELAQDFKNKGLIDKRNEATTRLHLIDRLLFKCLAWDVVDCISEESNGNTFKDYTLYIKKPRRSLIVEAKREGIYFELPAGKKRIDYSIAILKRISPDIFKAINQAMNYCQKSGTPIGAVCNGHQFICFLASREDGIAPLDGNAVVFDSLEQMELNFLKLWQYLSKPGVAEKKLQNWLVGGETPIIPPKLSTTITKYPGFKGRNLLQTELQILADIVFEDIAKYSDIEPQFIKYCYCTSGALSQYALTSKKILKQRSVALFDEEYDHPIIEKAMTKKGISKEFLANTLSSRPILLIGERGVGKTMFIKYLLNVEAIEILKDSIAIYIDFGTQATIEKNIKSFLFLEIKRQLLENYDIDIYKGNFVRGVYHKELIRFSEGIDGELKDIDPKLYKQKELSKLHELMSNDTEYIKHCFGHISKGRKKQIVLFLDNIDQREDETQQNAFFISHELATHWPVTVFLTLRPQTYHKSKKTGALSGYHLKAFSIEPPRVDEVLDKRLKFAQRITSGEIGSSVLRNGITFKLKNLQSYIDVLLWSFSKNKELIEFIDNISKGDIRLVLDIVNNFIGSAHVDTQEVLEKENTHKLDVDEIHYLVPLHHFLRAVIYGDGEHYDPQTSIIANLFDITHPDGKEHFLTPLIVEYINRISASYGKDGFIDVNIVYDYTQSLGFTPFQIDNVIFRALNKALIESEARKMPESLEELPSYVRITTVGLYHITKLIKQFSYVDAMIIDTPIIDETYRNKVSIVELIDDRLDRTSIFCDYLDTQWELLKNKNPSFDWPTVKSRLIQNIELIKSKKRKKYPRTP